MPELDVGELTVDPDLAGTRFIVVRRKETVNTFGERTSGIERFYPTGQVTPTGNNSLTREEAYQFGAKSIQVITRFLLHHIATDRGRVRYDPDIVIWRGDSFVVKSIDDYSEFGAGMIVAECASIDYVDQAPTPPLDPR